eukprot:CAMPEP_0194357676 /NCGR_PEP_ID=MMETSP0174-20130528/5126_1 /TAXON_ID=216777 /ORGANISM="Proboscia alata, Strain PI-D3" /LENGTH=185 /DNA_ID=CAMNT_0039127795 /DNA_START=48 /DNA_END=605 /DNA_ORIENTATION=+
MFRSFVLLLTFLTSLDFSNGETVSIAWVDPDTDDPAPPFQNKFKVGDTIVFNWPGVHNVAFHPNGGCDKTDAVILGSSTGYSYTVVEDDIGQKVFACDIGDHCSKGQLIDATISSDDGVTVTMTPTIAPVKATIKDPVEDPIRFPVEPPTKAPVEAPTKGIVSVTFQCSLAFQAILIAQIFNLLL